MSEILKCEKCNIEYPHDSETLHCCICRMNHTNNYCTSCEQNFKSGQHCCVCKWSGPDLKNYHSFAWHSTNQQCNSAFATSKYGKTCVHCAECN